MSNPFTDPKRSFKARRNAGNAGRNAHTLLIEGEYLTLGEIADRLGVTLSTASERHAKLCKLPGNITWAALETIR